MEDIWEGLAGWVYLFLRPLCLNEEHAEVFTKDLILGLSQRGVVRKVKCPNCEWSQFKDEVVGMTPCYSCDSTGYVEEPLIKEEYVHTKAN